MQEIKTPPEASEAAAEPRGPDGGTPQKKYRTRGQIRTPGAIVDMPDRLALPSRESFEGVLSTVENPKTSCSPLCWA